MGGPLFSGAKEHTGPGHTLEVGRTKAPPSRPQVLPSFPSQWEEGLAAAGSGEERLGPPPRSPEVRGGWQDCLHQQSPVRESRSVTRDGRSTSSPYTARPTPSSLGRTSCLSPCGFSLAKPAFQKVPNSYSPERVMETWPRADLSGNPITVPFVCSGEAVCVCVGGVS